MISTISKQGGSRYPQMGNTSPISQVLWLPSVGSGAGPVTVVIYYNIGMFCIGPFNF